MLSPELDGAQSVCVWIYPQHVQNTQVPGCEESDLDGKFLNPKPHNCMHTRASHTGLG